MKKMLATLAAVAVLSSISVTGFAAAPMKKDGVKKPYTEKTIKTKKKETKAGSTTGGAASMKHKKYHRKKAR